MFKEFNKQRKSEGPQDPNLVEITIPKKFSVCKNARCKSPKSVAKDHRHGTYIILNPG